MTTTFQKYGKTVARFNKDRCDEYDIPGKNAAKDFFRDVFGYDIIVNDKTPDGQIIFSHPDLVTLMSPDGKPTHIEAEIKEDKQWKHIPKGLDIPFRKTKYFHEAHLHPDQVKHFMSSSDGTRAAITLGKFMYLAYKSKGTKVRVVAKRVQISKCLFMDAM